MLSYNDLLLNLPIKPLKLAPYYWVLACFFALILFLLVLSPVPYLVPIYGVYLYWVYHCYLFFVVLKHPKSVTNIQCKQGQWQITQNNGQQQTDFILKHYYLSAFYVVLSFSKQQTNSGFQFFYPKKNVMITPSQVGEAEYRHLYRLLKFQHQALFLSKVKELTPS